MKYFLCVIIVAVLHRISGLPLAEQQTTISKTSSSLLNGEKVADLKLEDQSNASASGSEKLTFSSPSIKVDKVETAKTSSAAESVPQQVKSNVVNELKLAPTVSNEQQQQNQLSDTVNNAIEEAVRVSETDVKNEPQHSEAKNERAPVSVLKQKELNEQVVSVSTDEPKSLKNEAKSEIPKQEIKYGNEKSENVTAKTEAEQESLKSVTTEEPKKKKDSNEEKVNGDKAEQNLDISNTKDEVKDLNEKHNDQSKSEETGCTNAVTEKQKIVSTTIAKKEETKVAEQEHSFKSLPESPLPTDATTLTSALPVSVTPAVVEKSEQNREFIKREATPKEKHEDKKMTNAKKEKFNTASNESLQAHVKKF